MIDPKDLTEYAAGELFACDPSLNAPGVALFRGGQLVAAERVKVDPKWKVLPIGERCIRVASAAMRWGMAYNMQPRTLVLEWPQIYAANKSAGDPNDLPPLAGVGMALGGMLSLGLAGRGLALTTLSPTPAEWIGQVPKSRTGDPWSSARGFRIKTRLSEAEFAAVVPSHDAIDAVGLGLWAVGRLVKIRVLPGAT